MPKKKDAIASRHPQVILINDNSEDIVGAAAIIAEQIEEFRVIPFDKDTVRVIQKFTPPVILFALNTVMESIELYSQLVEDKVVAHGHDAILLCKNKESGVAFRACIKGLFDNYFVYQPLYEKFRLKIVVHNALLKHTVQKYQGITDEQFDTIDEELAELIDKGVETKNGLSGQIEDCKAKIDKVVNETAEDMAEDADSPRKVLEAIAQNHLGPLLESLEQELMASLDGMVAKMVEKKTLAAEAKLANNSKNSVRGNKLQTTVHNNFQRQQAEAEAKAKAQANGEVSSDGAAEEDTIDLVDDELDVLEDLPEEGSGESKKTVLVVEDNDLYREMLVKVLGDAGYKVSQADDGIAALKLIKQKRYDCILMDLFMPKLDGLNTTKHINKTGGDNPSPVIALTGNKRKDLFKKWAAMGIKSYIIKPSSKGEILEQVEKCMAQGKAE